VCENALINENLDEKAHFQEQFLEELKSLPEEVRANLNKSLVNDMRTQGDILAPLAIPFLKEFFGDFEVVSVEEQLFETIDNDFDFKGFIDLVVKTPDGKYHILDWKTCSWGWKPKRKSDAMTTYQLTFYKNYFAQKHNIDPKNIETYFALLKRTAKKDNVEIFRVTSGPKKTKNALNLLNKALHNIKKDFHPKNRSACQTPFGMCEFYNTEHCA
tara:strand:+ start:4613 stop:5257 length:645 start_codon:yes stop_codon:yes gene_type:complete